MSVSSFLLVQFQYPTYTYVYVYACCAPPFGRAAVAMWHCGIVALWRHSSSKNVGNRYKMASSNKILQPLTLLLTMLLYYAHMHTQTHIPTNIHIYILVAMRASVGYMRRLVKLKAFWFGVWVLSIAFKTLAVRAELLMKRMNCTNGGYQRKLFKIYG